MDQAHITIQRMDKAKACFQFSAALKRDRKFVLLLVFVALFLDNILLTAVVPMVPHELGDGEHVSCENETYQSSLIKINVSLHYSLVNHSSKSDDVSDKSLLVGVLLASKAVVQLIANPFVGQLTNKIGYSVPMFTGFCIIFVSTAVFAFGKGFVLLLTARCLQGLGSACSSVSGMGLLAEKYPDDVERGSAMGFALGGLAMGVLVGPVFGGLMYDYLNKSKTIPLLILSGIAIFEGLLQLVVVTPRITEGKKEPTSFLKLLKDPYIMIAAASITLANSGIAMLEATLPTWMTCTMHSSISETGYAFISTSLSYLAGAHVFGHFAHRMGRWLAALLGMLAIGVFLVIIPFCPDIFYLIAPGLGLGFSIGMVDATMMPIMGYLVDIRHSGVYGSVYAICDAAFCLAFVLGPLLGGVIVDKFDFPTMLFSMSVVCVGFAPLLWILRRPFCAQANLVPQIPSKCDRLNSICQVKMIESELAEATVDQPTLQKF